MKTITKTVILALLLTTLSINSSMFNPAQAGEDMKTISDIIIDSNATRENKSEIPEIQNKCRVLISEKKYDEAIKTIKSGLKKEPDNVDSLILLGNAYYAKKDNKSARETYEKAEKLQPDNIFVQMKLDLLKNENK